MEYRITLVLILYCVAIVFSEFDKTVKESKDTDDNSNNEEQLFTRLFKHRRAEQLEAVKRLVSLERTENQYKMVALVAEKVFSVIQGSRARLEGSGYIPGSSPFPQEEEIRDALSNILENTALFGDIVLRLPEIASHILRSKNEWEVLYHWSLRFSSQSSLLDKATHKLISLVEQELTITERDPNYVNPYRIQRKNKEQPSKSEEKLRKSDRKNKQEEKKKKQEEKKKKKGPRISWGEL